MGANRQPIHTTRANNRGLTLGYNSTASISRINACLSESRYQGLHRLIGKACETRDIPLRKLQGSITLQVERKDPWICFMFFPIGFEGLNWRIVTDPTLHIRQDYDPVVCSVGGLKDAVKVGSCRFCASGQLFGNAERRVTFIDGDAIRIVAKK